MATATQSVQQGWNQATAAQQVLMAMGLGSSGSRRRRASSRRTRASPKRRKRRATSKPRRRASSRRRTVKRLVKGSPAAKRHMAKLRRMRRRR